MLPAIISSLLLPIAYKGFPGTKFRPRDLVGQKNSSKNFSASSRKAPVCPRPYIHYLDWTTAQSHVCTVDIKGFRVYMFKARYVSNYSSTESDSEIFYQLRTSPPPPPLSNVPFRNRMISDRFEKKVLSRYPFPDESVTVVSISIFIMGVLKGASHKTTSIRGEDLNDHRDSTIKR